MNDRPRGAGFLAGLLVGGAVGAAAALLLANQETLDSVLGKAREAGNLAMDASGDLRERVEDAASTWQVSANELYERGRTIVENARASADTSAAHQADGA